MKSIHVYCFFVLYVVVGYRAHSQSVSTPISNDSFPFLNKSENHFQYAKAGLAQRLYMKWGAASTQKFVVAHFGDSHVQLDYFPSTVRKSLQAIKGNAGRGMCFPFAVAKTYSHVDLTSSFKGTWRTANSIESRPKIPLGISGFVAATSSPQASVQLCFKESLGKEAGRIRVYGKNQKGSYKIVVSSGSNQVSSLLSETTLNDSGYVDFSFASLKDTIQLSLQLETPGVTDTFFLYGLSVEKNQSGVLYHNLGVGGADYSALITQTWFERQIQTVNPDLVILDWGTNDIIYYNKIDDSLQGTILKTIRRVRKACPEALILLVSVQDMNYKGKNVTVCPTFNELIRKIAIEQGCFYYDWFQVAGGRRSMKTWERLELGRTDNIHLTAKGYRLKANLFTEAFQNTLQHIAENPNDSSWLSTAPEISIPEPILVETSTEEKIVVKKPAEKNTKTSTKEIYYTVKAGDSFVSIANKHKTTVEKIKKLNPKKATLIKPGDRLRIQ